MQVNISTQFGISLGLLSLFRLLDLNVAVFFIVKLNI